MVKGMSDSDFRRTVQAFEFNSQSRITYCIYLYINCNNYDKEAEGYSGMVFNEDYVC